jgi:predicted Zn-dependent protease
MLYLSFDFGGFAEVYVGEKLENIFKLRHTRVHEERADHWGLKMMHRAGFDLE